MKTFAVALLGFASCIASQPPPAPMVRGEVFYVVPSDLFAGDERSAILAAEQRWNIALNGFATFVEAERGNVQISYKREDEAMNNHYLAWCDRVRGHQINLVPERSYRQGWGLEEISLHEFGHILGLYDVDSRAGTLMSSPVNSMIKCIDEYTLRALSWKNGWDFERMRPECPPS